MEKIDKFILQKFQRFADWIQISFGITNFTISRICLILWFSINIFQNCVVVGVHGFMTFKSTLSIFDIFIMTIFSFFFWIMIYFAEKGSENSPQFKNSFEISFSVLRKVVLLFVILDIFTIVKQTMVDVSNTQEAWQQFIDKILLYKDIAQLLFVYFISCTPKPPQKSKIQELIEKIFLKPATVGK